MNRYATRCWTHWAILPLQARRSAGSLHRVAEGTGADAGNGGNELQETTHDRSGCIHVQEQRVAGPDEDAVADPAGQFDHVGKAGAAGLFNAKTQTEA